MKRISFLFVAGLLMSIAASAQTTSFGIRGGVNANTFYLKSEGSGSDSRYSLTKPGFHVGGVANIQFNPNWSVQPQLLFAMKGGKLQQSGSSADFTFYTIDLPVNLLYHYNGFFIGAGPNFSYGVSGKGKSGTSDFDLYDEAGVGDGKFKRFEIGVNSTLGFQFPSGLVLSTNYTPGLSNGFDANSSATGTITTHNSYWGFSIGYMFGNNAMKKK